MNDFLKYAIPFKSNYTPVKLTSLFLKKIEETVLDQLNLKNLNHLRDRFEGVAYYEKVSNFLFGLFVLENHLGKPLIDWKSLKQKRFHSNLSSLQLDVNIITFKMGGLPVIDKINSSPIIFIIKRNDKSGWICGLADTNTLNAENNQQKLQSIGRDESKVLFTGFDQLKGFENLDELKSLLKDEEMSFS